MRTRLIAAALALVALATVAQAQPCLPPTPTPDFEKAVIKTTDLGNRTYVLEGVGGTVGGNVTVAVGDDGVIVVDNMFAQMYGKIKAAIAAVTSQPVRYVVNTHFHRDHTGGNEAFAKDGAVIVAHENLKRVLASGSKNGLNCAVTPPVPEVAHISPIWPEVMIPWPLSIGLLIWACCGRSTAASQPLVLLTRKICSDNRDHVRNRARP